MSSARPDQQSLLHSSVPESQGFMPSLLLHLGLMAAVWFSGYASFLRAPSTKPQLMVIELSQPSGAPLAKPVLAQPKPKKDVVKTAQAAPIIPISKPVLKASTSVPAAAEEIQISRDNDVSQESTEEVSQTESVPTVTGLGGRAGGTRVMTPRERYLAEILSQIERQKFYPTDARIRRQTGMVEVTFSVLADGSIAGVELTRPSSFASLNRAGVSILQKIGRFSPIPNELGEREVRLTVPIEYGLR